MEVDILGAGWKYENPKNFSLFVCMTVPDGALGISKRVNQKIVFKVKFHDENEYKFAVKAESENRKESLLVKS